MPLSVGLNRTLPAVFAVSLVWVSSATADWLVLRNGERSEVRAVQIRERSVDIVTLNDKTWSLARGLVDVEKTRTFNGMTENEGLSPGWPRPDAPAELRATARTAPEAMDRRPKVRESQTRIEPQTSVAPPSHTSPPLPPPDTSPPKPQPPPPSDTNPPPSPPPPPPSRSPPPRLEETTVGSVEDVAGTRLALAFNGLTESSGFGLTESRSFSSFNETGTLDVDYREPRRSGYEVGASVRILGPVGIAASAELFDSAPSAIYRDRLPHPFFYDRLRDLSGEQPDLSWTERAVHIDPVLSLDFGRRLSVDVFSGVSMFFTKTELVDDVLYEEVFPYDTVVSKGTTLRRMEARPLGYNLGVSTTLRLLGVLGVDFGLRYSRAGVHLELAEGRVIDFDAGGLRYGAGLRILIP